MLLENKMYYIESLPPFDCKGISYCQPLLENVCSCVSQGL